MQKYLITFICGWCCIFLACESEYAASLRRGEASHREVQAKVEACYASPVNHLVIDEERSTLSCVPNPPDWAGYTSKQETQILLWRAQFHL